MKQIVTFLAENDKSYTVTLYECTEGIQFGVQLLRGVQNITGTFVRRSIPVNTITHRQHCQLSNREKRSLDRYLKTA